MLLMCNLFAQFSLIFSLLIFSQQAVHGETTAEINSIKLRQLRAMEVFVEEWQSKMATEYKEMYLGIYLQDVESEIKNLIQTATTLEESLGLVPKQDRPYLDEMELEQLLIGMSAKWLDGHTNYHRKNQNMATLGIKATLLDGKLKITGFANDYYRKSGATEPLKIGDEVVSLNGESISKIVERNRLYAWGGNLPGKKHRRPQYGAQPPLQCPPTC